MNAQELTQVSDWVNEREQRICNLKYEGYRAFTVSDDEIDFLGIFPRQVLVRNSTISVRVYLR